LLINASINSALKGTDEDELPSPTYLGKDGSYHIPDSTTVTLMPAIRKISANCVPIAKLAGGAVAVVLVAPIPRYITRKCCVNVGHVEIYNSDDIESEVAPGVEIHRRILEGWASGYSLHHRIVQ
jgi:hypothetical protein